VTDKQQIQDAATLAKVMDRAMRTPKATLVSESECDAIERWAIDYAGKRGVHIKPNQEPKPWKGARNDAGEP
jgi:hypothetical protein